jgi:hypothetical protein
MSTLTVLVLHPHQDPVTGEWRYPGDLVKWTSKELELREQFAPFPYYHVETGTRVREPEATRVGPNEELPDGSPLAVAMRIAEADKVIEQVATAVEKLNTLTMPNGEVPEFSDPDGVPFEAAPEGDALTASMAGVMEPPATVTTKSQVTVLDSEPEANPSTNEPDEPQGLDEVSILDGTLNPAGPQAAEPEANPNTNEPDEPQGLDETAVVEDEVSSETVEPAPAEPAQEEPKPTEAAVVEEPAKARGRRKSSEV